MSVSQRRFCSAMSCAFSTATAADAPREASVSSSSCVKGPPRLFTTWNTPITCAFCPVIGNVSRLFV